MYKKIFKMCEIKLQKESIQKLNFYLFKFW